MAPLITSLHQSLQVTPAEDDQVQVTVTLPADLLNDFVGLLDSLSGFVTAINHQKHLARLRDDSEETKKRFQFKAQFNKRLVRDYDRYRSQGLTRKDAIKQLSADLHKENHPWRCPDLIRSALIEAGRPGRIGRPSRKQS